MVQTSKPASQLWRFVRLFGITFGATLLSSANASAFNSHIGLKAELAAVVSAAVAALEVAYRAVAPVTGESRLMTLLVAVRDTYRSLGKPAAAAAPAEKPGADITMTPLQQPVPGTPSAPLDSIRPVNTPEPIPPAA